MMDSNFILKKSLYSYYVAFHFVFPMSYHIKFLFIKILIVNLCK